MSWDDHMQGVLQQGFFTRLADRRAEGLADDAARAIALAERAHLNEKLAKLGEVEARSAARLNAAELSRTRETLSKRDEYIECLVAKIDIRENIIKNLEAQLGLSDRQIEALWRSYTEMGRQMDSTTASLQAVLRQFPEVGEWMGQNGLRFEVSCSETRAEIYKENLSEVKLGAPRHEGKDEPAYLEKIYERIIAANMK